MLTAVRDLLPDQLEWQPGQAAEALAKLPAKPGVWLLLAEGGIPVLAATSQNMRAVVAGRLTSPDPAQRSRRTDLSRTVVACRFAVTYGRFESDWLYGRLVHALWPNEFWDRVSFGPMWMLQAFPVRTPPTASAGGIMKLQPTTNWPEEPGTIALGPLATRGDAQDLADSLTDLFDLCRYWQILLKTPHGTPCAYFEMGRSPAPCAGRIPIEQYNQTVRDAMAFAGQGRTAVLEARRSEMRTAAAQLQFEQAARIKDWLARAAVLDEPRFAHLADIQRFVGLAVSKFRTQVRPFFFWAGVLEPGEAVKISSLEEQLPAWRQRLQAGPATTVDTETRRWQCGLLATHLFRPERRNLGWFILDCDPQAWIDAANSLRSVTASED